MKEISELHFRVCDHGLFTPIARRLAREAKRVTYWTPWEKDFPRVRDCLGDGFPDIERVDSFLEDQYEVDCWVFPDVGFAEEQKTLAQLHHTAIWGARHGDELEVNRGKFLEVLKQIGLPVPKYEKVKGINNLKAALFPVKDRWVKISKFRGDCETFHWRSRSEDENALDQLANKFGPFRELIPFYVFEPIDADIEDGCDSWCINGQFPQLVIHGMESKDQAYLGAFQRYDDLPEEVRVVDEAFAPVLQKYGYRSFFSSEVRITDQGDSYFIDPTCRAGSPPSQVMTEMIDNYAEVIWGGANGECVDPIPAAKFGVQAVVHTKRDEHEWTYVKVDDELDRWLKSSRVIGHGDLRCLPPGRVTGCEDWLVGIGDTIEEAVKHLIHNTKLLPCGVTCETAPISDLLEEIQEAEEAGMEFTEQKVPDPTIVIE